MIALSFGEFLLCIYQIALSFFRLNAGESSISNYATVLHKPVVIENSFFIEVQIIINGT